MELKDNVSGRPWDDFQKDISETIELTRNSLIEVNLMLEQSKTELAKLTQRNVTITNQLQQVQSIKSLTGKEVQKICRSVLDAQQRLLVMRSQVEKLKSEQSGLQQLRDNLEKVKKFIFEDSKSLTDSGTGGSGVAALEMMVNAQESVRHHLSQQIHDGPAQTLSNFIIQTEIATRLFDTDQEKAGDELEKLKSAALGAFNQIRSFIFELRPMILDDTGLITTIKRYKDSLAKSTGLDVTFKINGQERRFEPYLEVMVYRASQELMINAVRHNKDWPDKIQIDVTLIIEDNFVEVIVSDNGKGFNPEKVKDSDGLGLKLIKERVKMLGGNFDIISAEGQGSKVSFQVPASEVESP